MTLEAVLKEAVDLVPKQPLRIRLLCFLRIFLLCIVSLALGSVYILIFLRSFFDVVGEFELFWWCRRMFLLQRSFRH